MTGFRRMAVGACLVATLMIAPGTAHAIPIAPAPVAVIGDFGSGTDDERRVADLVASARPVAVVTTGDNVYDSADYARLVGDYYGRYVASQRLLPAAGNHDHSEGIEAFDRYFSYLHGQRTYSFGRGGIRFFVIDSTAALDSSQSMATQRAWLQQALQQSRARWKVVVLHHPPYSSGTTHGSSPELRWPFGTWGADLVLAGHEHNYERLVEGGMTYVVDGAGGKDLYRLGAPIAGSVARTDTAHGALFLTATPTALSGAFRTVDGATTDRFTLRP